MMVSTEKNIMKSDKKGKWSDNNGAREEISFIPATEKKLRC
jgi:hypothetical protein